MSQSNVPESSNMQKIQELTKIPKEKNEASILQTLQTRRKLIADFYFHKGQDAKFDNTPEVRQKYYDELKYLHEYFGYAKVWSAIKKQSGFSGKPVRTIDEKKSDIDLMHDHCWKKAVGEALKVFKPDIKSFEGVEVDKSQRSRDILTSVFYKAYVENWSS